MNLLTKEQAQQAAAESKVVQTICGDCVFSKEQPNDNENLEDYCECNRIKPIENKGGEIVSIDAGSGKNTKAISGRICNIFRTDIWKEHQEQKHGINTTEALIEKAKKEIHVRCTVVIYVGFDEEIEKLDEKQRRSNVKKRIKSAIGMIKQLEKDSVAPQKVVIVNNTSTDVYDFLNFSRIEANSESIKTAWSIEHINKLNEDIKSLDNNCAVQKCLDLVSKNDESHYISLFFEGENIPESYLSSINFEINEKLERFLVLFPEKTGGGNGLFFQAIAYKQFYGNRDGDFLTKLKQEAEKQQCQHMIKSLSSIFPSR